MTYASIEEAWGGISGSNMLSIPLHKKEHPIHTKQKQNPDSGIYQCTYGSQHCNQVVNANNNFNEQKKLVAAGMQNYPHQQQQIFTYLPQYPWYPIPREQYLQYSPMISAMWYNDPWMYDPVVAEQIARYQAMHGTRQGSIARTGFHQGFAPPVYKKQKRVEHFTNDMKDPIKTGMVYFIFFLIALAVILVIALICLCSIRK